MRILVGSVLYRRLTGLILAGAALWCVAPLQALAQEEAPAAPIRGKKINIDEVRIVGRIAKPQVQFIISREKGTTDEALELKASFVPKIIESVESLPF